MTNSGIDDRGDLPRRALVGRQAEVAQLRGLVADAARGRSSFVSLVGDPGIGKTLLAQEFLDIAESEGAQVAFARCHEDTDKAAFRPWLHNLRSILERPEAANLYELVGMNNQPDEVAPISISEAAPGPTLREAGTALAARIELFDAVIRCLHECSTVAPVVLLFEDVHWADSATLLLLRFAAKEIAASGIVIAVTHRPEQIYSDPPFAPAMRAWQAEHLHTRIDLKGLDLDDAAKLIQQEAARVLARDITPELIEKSGGNPLLLIQLVHHLLEDKRPTGSPQVTPELPSNVSDVILSRISSVSETARTLLEAAACSGALFEHPQLQATVMQLSDTSEDQILDAVDECLSLALIEEDVKIGTYRFSHALIRESLLANLPARRKRMIHGAIVEAIETILGGRTDSHLQQLAYHSYQSAIGGSSEKAFQYAESIAVKAWSNFAYDEAALWYGRALEILRLHAPSNLRHQTLCQLSLAIALSMAGNGSEAHKTFVEAIENARSLEDWELFGWSTWLMSNDWMHSGIMRMLGEGSHEALLLEALERADESDLALRSALLARIGSERANGDPASARDLARQAVELADRQDEPTFRSSARAALRIIDWKPDNLPDRLELSTAAVDTAREMGDPLAIAFVLPLRIIDLLESGASDEAKAETESFRTASQRILAPFFLWQLGLFESMWMLAAGGFDQAERRAQEAFNLGFEHNPADATGLFSAFNFALAWLRGNLADHEHGLREVMNFMPIIPGWRAALALICSETAQPDLAREQLDQLIEPGLSEIPRDGVYLTTMTLIAESVHNLGDATLATEVLPFLEPFSDRLVVVGNGVACHGSVAGFTASLHGLTGNNDQANRLFQQALALETRLESRPLSTLTRARWIEHLIRSGDDGSATRELIDRAETDAKLLGMRAVVARLQQARSAPTAAGSMQEKETEESRPRGVNPHPAGFRLAGDYREISFEGLEIRLKESKGLTYTEHLLRNPGRDFFAVELVALLHKEGETTPRAGDAGESIDRQAVTAYRRRVDDLRQELIEAEDLNDLGRMDRLREEMEMIADQLGGGLGIGGRSRRAASDNERARVNVTRAIRSALRKISDAHPSLGRRLLQTIKTGNICSYEPDPDRPVDWDF